MFFPYLLLIAALLSTVGADDVAARARERSQQPAKQGTWTRPTSRRCCPPSSSIPSAS